MCGAAGEYETREARIRLTTNIDTINHLVTDGTVRGLQGIITDSLADFWKTTLVLKAARGAWTWTASGAGTATARGAAAATVRGTVASRRVTVSATKDIFV
jgi:hypothetical protein